MSKEFDILRKKILNCEACPRLRTYCKKVAHDKKREFQNEEYLGLPVPGFGDEQAKLLIVGLAPAAHGGNRTGRMFTGDNSGVWLYRALFKAGFGSKPQSLSRDDLLTLRGVYIAAVARCAPPENKPARDEIERCKVYLETEIALLKEVKVFLVLGLIGLKGLWTVLPDYLKPHPALPKFSHGAHVTLNDGRILVCSFHPSQQNTFTRKLTEPMFDSIFSRINGLLERMSS